MEQPLRWANKKSFEANQPDLALLLSNLGALEGNQGNYEKAREFYDAALTIRSGLAQRYPGAYLPVVVDTLANLAKLDRLQGHLEDSHRHYDEALKDHLQLTDANQNYLPDLAQGLQELGVQEALQSEVSAAYQDLEDAVTMMQQLAEREPDKYNGVLARTLNDLGTVSDALGLTQESREDYEEALKIQEQLVKQDPEKYTTDLALTFDNFGVRDANEGLGQQAREKFEKALRYFRDLAAKDPGENTRRLVHTLDHLLFRRSRGPS